jgi:hypothetical protein
MCLLLLFFTWGWGKWILSHTRQRDDLLWVRLLVAMVRVSPVGYMPAGAFLGRQYFGLYYHLEAVILVTSLLFQGQFEKNAKAGVEVRNADTSHAKDHGSIRSGTPQRAMAVLGGNR